MAYIAVTIYWLLFAFLAFLSLTNSASGPIRGHCIIMIIANVIMITCLLARTAYLARRNLIKPSLLIIIPLCFVAAFAGYIASGLFCGFSSRLVFRPYIVTINPVADVLIIYTGTLIVSATACIAPFVLGRVKFRHIFYVPSVYILLSVAFTLYGYHIVDVSTRNHGAAVKPQVMRCLKADYYNYENLDLFKVLSYTGYSADTLIYVGCDSETGCAILTAAYSIDTRGYLKCEEPQSLWGGSSDDLYWPLFRVPHPRKTL